MKQATIYICEVCGAKFNCAETCEDCEAIHFGLTRSEYLRWKALNKEAALAGKRISTCKDKNTSQSFDRAIEELVKFEAEHRIKIDCKKPSDFYYA